MRTHILALILLLSLIVSGCYAAGMSGTVVNAENNKPIKGAVVLVEWTKRHGIGDYHTESVKVVEVLTDKDGKFKVEGILAPFVDPPDVVVYKKGYVAWSSRAIFPDGRERTDFQWQDRYVFKLEHFKPEYSYDEHQSFIHSATNSSLGSKEIIEKAYRWEELKAFEERKQRWNK